jgi:hypothetical protein
LYRFAFLEGRRTMKTSVPASLAAALLALISVLGALAQTNHVYIDSQQRFTIEVPKGWLAKSFNTGGVSGVTVSHGSEAYVQVFLQKGIDPASFLNALNNGIQNSHAGYKVANRGTRTVAGEPRMFIVGEAPASPTAPRTRVYLETFAANGFSYAIIASSSGKATAGKESGDYEISQQMIDSLTLNGTPAHPPAAAAKAPPAAVPPRPAPSAPPVAAPPSAAATPVVPPATPPATVAAPPTKPDAAPNENASILLLPEDQKKLAAMDTALKGGAISDEEYQTKKNVVYSGARKKQEDAALLKALDQALADGVLTKDEYDRKKRDLIGDANSEPTAARDQAVAAEPPAELKSREIVAKADPPPEPLPSTWTTDTDPAGFAVSRPAAWTMGKIRATGQVVLHGTRGEEVMIWPLRLKQAELDANGAAALTQELARKFDVLMPWSPVQTMKNAARVSGSGSQRSGTVVLSWANNPTGVSIYFYGVEAPQEIYNDSTTAFAAILRSFHVVPDPSVKDILGAPSGPGAAPLDFVSWTDPHEGAFTVPVPQGWHVIGGTYRLSTVDVRYGMVMNSPDGQIRASVGDSMVGPFTQPSQALTASGLREGSYQTLSDGTRVELLRYLSGQQFARSYVETLVSRQCSNPQISSNNSREDLASNFSQSAASVGFTDALLTAGDVSFTCTMDGKPVKGKYIAATIRMAPNISPIWLVYRLYGYIAFSGREQDGEEVLMQMVRSWKFTPEWEALRKDAAMPAVQTEIASSQEIRQRAQEAIVEDQRQTAEMIAKSSEQRQKLYDQLERKRQNSILGSLEITDAQTGAQYKVSDFSDYHYLSGDGYIYSANSREQSGADLKDLLAIP